MKLAFIGPPLSGKGSQAKMLMRELGIRHVSTGDLFRQAIADKTELGVVAKSYMDKGLLVPDELTIELLLDHLATFPEETGFVLDGFPRTIAQARALDEKVQLDKIFLFTVSHQTLIDRLAGRLSCPTCGTPYHVRTLKPKVEGICDHCQSELIQRADDNIEAFNIRLDAFFKETGPAIDYYKNSGRLIELDSSLGLEKLLTLIVEAVK